MNGDCVAAGCGFSNDVQPGSPGKDQYSALSACLFERRAHERVEQFVQYHLARYRLGDGNYRCKVQAFQRQPDRCSRRRRALCTAKVWKEPVELLNLAIGAPTQVAVAGILKVDPGDLLKSPRRVEARCQFVGERLVMDEITVSRAADRLFVEVHRIGFAIFDAG